MSRWLLVALPLLIACKRSPAAADADATGDATTSSPPPIESEPPPPPPPPPQGPTVDFTPDASASPDDRKKALAALLAGTSPARDLVEHATEADAGFANELRERLTTVAVSTGPAPGAQAQIGESTATVKIGSADRTLAGLRPRMRQCYQTGLNSDPSMSGKLTIAAKVLPNGEVASAEAKSNSGLSASVAQCAARVVRRAQFDAPGGSGSVLTVPITFTQE